MGIFEKLTWLTTRVKRLCCAVEQIQQSGGGSYKVYSAIVDITNVSAPIVLENTLGVSITITNPTNGFLRFTSPSSVFLSNKTFISSSTAIDASNDAYFIVGKRANAFGDKNIEYRIRKYDNTQSFTPNIPGGVYIEIRVYN